jgi:hypothetical protein
MRPIAAPLLLLCLLIPPAATAAEDAVPEPVAACAAPEHRQFDFWLGQWNVSANEQAAGSNEVRSIHGGCALQENWRGAGEGGISGTSLNLYDRTTGRWHQTWVDSSGTLLQLDGGLVDGSMVLAGEQTGAGGRGSVLHRITWTPNEDGTVRQLWEASQDGGANWNVLFNGLYQRAGADG